VADEILRIANERITAPLKPIGTTNLTIPGTNVANPLSTTLPVQQTAGFTEMLPILLIVGIGVAFLVGRRG
jgi:hypothetical protein